MAESSTITFHLVTRKYKENKAMWINLQPVNECQILFSFKSTEILLLISSSTGLNHICTLDWTVFSPWFYFINSNLPISILLLSSLFLQMMTNPKFMLRIKSLANHASIFMKCHTAKEIAKWAREAERPNRRIIWTRLMTGNTMSLPRSSFPICYQTASNTCLPLSKEKDD